MRHEIGHGARRHQQRREHVRRRHGIHHEHHLRAGHVRAIRREHLVLRAVRRAVQQQMNRQQHHAQHTVAAHAARARLGPERHKHPHTQRHKRDDHVLVRGKVAAVQQHVHDQHRHELARLGQRNGGKRQVTQRHDTQPRRRRLQRRHKQVLQEQGRHVPTHATHRRMLPTSHERPVTARRREHIETQARQQTALRRAAPAIHQVRHRHRARTERLHAVEKHAVLKALADTKRIERVARMVHGARDLLLKQAPHKKGRVNRQRTQRELQHPVASRCHRRGSSPTPPPPPGASRRRATPSTWLGHTRFHYCSVARQL